VWSELWSRLAEGWITAVLGAFALCTLLQYLALNVLACLEGRRERHREHLADRRSLFEGELAPPISILVPAYNEQLTIVDAVRSLMELRYPSTEIIVVNDGSKDRTLETLQQEFLLRPSERTMRADLSRDGFRGVYSSPRYPSLVVVDVENGGKARALNVALAYARHPLVCAIDADSVLERDALLELAQPFYQEDAVAVTGGVVRPANGGRIERGRVLEARVSPHHLARFQTLEYLRGMLVGRLGWDRLDSLFIVSGALGLFSRHAVMAVGGYRTETLGEDMELVMRIQRWAHRTRRPRAVRFVSNAVAWTEVPERVAQLSRQRQRWHQGLAESLWLNRGLLLSAKVSLHHAIAYLTQLFVELLGPIWELLGLILLGFQLAAGRLDAGFATLYVGVFVLAGTINSLFGIALESVVCPRYRRAADSVVLVIYAFLESFGYRQLTAIWRLQGIWNVLHRRRDWGANARLGHAVTAERESRRAA